MPHRLTSLIASLSLIGFCFSGCSYMTAQGRREMAYRHYVDKHIRQRQKQMAKAQKAANRRAKEHLQPEIPSEPIVNAGTEPQTTAPIAVSSFSPVETTTEPPP